MTAMYLEHFGLREAPFRIMPHTEFFFSGAHRGSTLEALIYAVTHDEGIVKVSGEVGSGKTMLCRMLLERLPKHIKAVCLTNPSLPRDEMRYALAEELKIDLPEGRPHLVLRTLQDALLEIHAAGHRVVVMVDEAHAMPSETLEEICLLSNLESSQHKLMHIVLFGQPELDKRLSEKSMRQLKERITHNFALEPLGRDEIATYLLFRMRAAGYAGTDIFSPKAIGLIEQASEGLTRRINILADKALLLAFSEHKQTIEAKHIKAAIIDAQFTHMNNKGASYKPWGSYGKLGFSGAMVALLLVALMIWQLWFSIHNPSSVSQADAMIQDEPSQRWLSVAEAAPQGVSAASLQTEGVFPVADETQQDPPVASQQPEEGDRPSIDERILMTIAWMKETPNAHFFIQLFSVDARRQDEAQAFIELISTRLEAQDIRVYRSRLSGRDRIGIIYGDYATEAEAAATLAKIRNEIPGSNPYVRSVSKLR